ncbi:MAG: tungstate ABC transporter substrate-binding protein WtpA [Anaerolineae bacterium]|nr:tungstate ABC transporter substrate-binding protein WtpA [Anaerolineae bacterium]
MKPRPLLCLVLAAALVACAQTRAPASQATQAQPAATLPARAQPVPTPTEAIAPQVERVPLVVFAAGSLIVPFAALESAFEAQYPHIDVRAEYHGSIQVIRHVTELHDEIDVVTTADATLIPMLMYAVDVPETGQPYAAWYARFASNRIAVAYTPHSQRAAEIDAANWTEVLSDRSVRVGLSDPRFDALGYRALMVFALAQELYERPTLFADMYNGRFTRPVTLFWDDDRATVTVPEILESRPETGLILRGASIQLIALLQSGDVDYAFEYESVIQQHGLQMLPLPEALNLGGDGMEDVYSQVQVNLDFRRFASVKPQFQGERIGYGITIPSNAPHPKEAATYIAFLLGPEGRAIMEAHHHPLFDPPVGEGYAHMPTEIRALCAPAEAP